MNCQNIREAIEMKRTPEAAHLAECQSCQTYSREMDSLFSLLRAQPRVEAPDNFNFQLRRRIAQAQAEQQQPAGVAGWAAKVSQLWSGSFSWAQATAAMAAVAAVVSVSTYQFNQQQPLPVAAVAINSQASVSPVAGAAMVSTLTTAGRGERETTGQARVASTSSAGRVAVERARNSADSLAVNTGDELAAERVDAASGANNLRVFSNEQGRMISAAPQMTLIGAEGAGAGTRTAGFVPSI